MGILRDSSSSAPTGGVRGAHCAPLQAGLMPDACCLLPRLYAAWRADCPRYRRVIARPVRKLAVAIRVPRPLMPDASSERGSERRTLCAAAGGSVACCLLPRIPRPLMPDAYCLMPRRSGAARGAHCAPLRAGRLPALQRLVWRTLCAASGGSVACCLASPVP